MKACIKKLKYAYYGGSPRNQNKIFEMLLESLSDDQVKKILKDFEGK